MFVDIDGQLQVKSQIHRRTQKNDPILIKVYCMKDESTIRWTIWIVIVAFFLDRR